MKSRADDLPRRRWKALTYGVVSAALAVIGFESRADWKTDANTRIEQIRKRDWSLQVVDTAGQPVAGAAVSLRQRRHQFGFGCALNSSPLIDEPRYSDFFSRNFEWLVCENETKWTSDEPAQGQLDYRRPDLMLAFGRKHGLLARGHCIFWEATGGGYEHPAWLDALSTPQLSAAVDARLASVVPYYRGSFEHWDINNEMLHGNYFRGRLGNAIVPHMFQTAAALDPHVLRFVNDYNVVAGSETASYLTQITNLLATGAAVTGIGAQGHFNSQIIDPVTVKSRLDSLSALDLPIWVTEYDSVQANATNRADNLETLYRVAFGETNVQGILMWGFWANSHWLGSNAAIVDANWTVNTAGQRFTNLMQEWTTVTNGVTDANGFFSARGFHGDYDVTLSAAGQSNVVRSLLLTQGIGTQSNAIAFGTNALTTLKGSLIAGKAITLNWNRFTGAGSTWVESSTNLSFWEMVSPRLDNLAARWTYQVPSDNAPRFFRVRTDSTPPPNFDFFEATGAKRTGTISATGQFTTADTGILHRNSYLFASPDYRNGSISLTEDNTQASPAGGPPGILRFVLDAKPTTVGQDYWGFILRPGSIANWPAANLGTADLVKSRLRFRYKLTAGRVINLRIEPASGGYNQRCDFGNITGNGQWQEFNSQFSSGANGTAFLAFLNAGGERYLNLVFGSGTSLAGYSSGDALWLDDVSVHSDP